MGFALSDMQLTSTAFVAGDRIPAQYTCEGDDVSPALQWSGAPDGTQEFALICHDPDAPLIKPATYGFAHWVLCGIPGTASELPEGVADYIAGSNDFGNVGYGGPAPPPGHGTHHYFFWLLALDADEGTVDGEARHVEWSWERVD